MPRGGEPEGGSEDQGDAAHAGGERPRPEPLVGPRRLELQMRGKENPHGSNGAKRGRGETRQRQTAGAARIGADTVGEETRGDHRHNGDDGR